MESLRHRIPDLSEADIWGRLFAMLDRVVPGGIGSWSSAEWICRRVWPPRMVFVGKQAHDLLEPMCIRARHGVPPEGWVSNSASLAAKPAEHLDHLLASTRDDLELAWPHLGLPRPPTAPTSDPAVQLRFLSAWGRLVNLNLEGIETLSAALVLLARKLSLLLPVVIMVVLTLQLFAGPRTFVHANGRLGMLLQFALVVVCCGAFLVMLQRVRALVRVTDPRVNVLLAAGHAVDCGHSARLAACAAGRALHPPAECATPDDLIGAFRDRGLEPMPLAPLLVATAREELPPAARGALVELLYRRALELEHARLSAGLAAWVARRELVPIVGSLVIGISLLIVVLSAFEPTLAALRLR